MNSVLGAQLRHHRSQGGMSQADLAREVGEAQQQIQKYDVGGDRLPVDMLRLICAALGVDQAEAFRVLNNELIQQAGAAETSDFGRPDVVQFVHAFYRITNEAVRKRVLNLVKALVTGGADTFRIKNED